VGLGPIPLPEDVIMLVEQGGLGCTGDFVGASLAISVVRERILSPAHEKLNKNLQKANQVSLGQIPLPEEVMMLVEQSGLGCTGENIENSLRLLFGLEAEESCNTYKKQTNVKRNSRR